MLRKGLFLYLLIVSSSICAQGDALLYYPNNPPKNVLDGTGGFKDPSELFLIDRLFGPSQYDSRIEVNQLDSSFRQHQQMREVRQSVGMVVEKTQLTYLGDGTVQLTPLGNLQKIFNLCSTEPFLEQPVAGFGTAFLIGKDTMCSAMHVFEGDADQYSIVFGYEIDNDGEFSLIVKESDVFEIQDFTSSGVDYELDVAIFTLKESCNRPPLELSDSRVMDLQTPIYSVGYPLGLPTKYAVNAHIVNNDNVEHFYTSLDAFRGNSGSPVFRADSHEVIGVLVSGKPEFLLSGNCNISAPCSAPDCEGERIVRIEQVIKNYE